MSVQEFPYALPTFGNTLFPPSVNPHAGEAEDHARAWLESHQLLAEPRVRERYRKTRLGESMGFCFPEAGPEVLAYAGELLGWITVFDDTFAYVTASADVARAIPELIGIVEGAPARKGTGFAAALSASLTKIRRTADPVHADRIVQALRTDLLAQYWEMGADRNSVSLDEYLAVRPRTVYGTVLESFAEPAGNWHLTDRMRRLPDVHRVITAALNLLGMCNDIVSYPWEIAMGETELCSLIPLLMHDRGYGTADAFIEASRLCDREAMDAHDALTRIESGDNPELQPFARTMRLLIGGISACENSATERFTL
ncbi:terpene synthase family protein [Kitasatospora sp. NPDC001574]